MSVATLSGKCQIVIPAEVRRRLKLVPGDKIAVEIEGDRAVLRKVEGSALARLKALVDPGEFRGYAEELQRSRDEWDRT